MEYTHIRYSDITRVLILWVQSSTMEDGWSPNDCVRRAVHAYIIKHPISTQLILVMEYTDIRYSDITTCIDLWVPEQHNWRTDGLQMNCVREAVSCLHIKHQLKHNWLLVMEYTHIRYSDITTCIDSVVPGAQLEDGWSPNELYEGAVSCLLIKHPIQPIDSLDEYTDIRYSDITTCIDSVSARAENWGRMVSNDCMREAVSCLQIRHPISTHWLLVMEYTHISTVTLLCVWFCECQAENWGTDGIQWIVWGEQSHAYIIKHPLKPTWSLWWIHWHQVQWHSTVLILWVPELENWGRWSQMHCVGEQFMLT